MTNVKDVRCAHDLLDRLDLLMVLSEEQEKLLRSFLPELPKQKTLEEITEHVYDAWIGTEQSEWPDDVHGDLETWLAELRIQLQGLTSAESAHPEFLETGADYQDAPGGTVVAIENADTAWIKKGDTWSNTDGERRTGSQVLWGVPRKVLRWSWRE